MNMLTTFMLLSIVNVVFATARQLTTIKGSKSAAALMSGGYYAFYNIMLIYTVSEFPMWQKCVITFICNVIGVYFVKWVEEKTRKDKLWKIETTIPLRNQENVCTLLKDIEIPFNYIEGIGKYVIFNIYCETSAESESVKQILSKYNAKYFVSETKNL